MKINKTIRPPQGGRRLEISTIFARPLNKHFQVVQFERLLRRCGYVIVNYFNTGRSSSDLANMAVRIHELSHKMWDIGKVNSSDKTVQNHMGIPSTDPAVLAQMMKATDGKLSSLESAAYAMKSFMDVYVMILPKASFTDGSAEGERDPFWSLNKITAQTRDDYDYLSPGLWDECAPTIRDRDSLAKFVRCSLIMNMVSDAVWTPTKNPSLNGEAFHERFFAYLNHHYRAIVNGINLNRNSMNIGRFDSHRYIPLLQATLNGMAQAKLLLLPKEAHSCVDEVVCRELFTVWDSIRTTVDMTSLRESLILFDQTYKSLRGQVPGLSNISAGMIIPFLVREESQTAARMDAEVADLMFNKFKELINGMVPIEEVADAVTTVHSAVRVLSEDQLLAAYSWEENAISITPRSDDSRVQVELTVKSFADSPALYGTYDIPGESNNSVKFKVNYNTFSGRLMRAETPEPFGEDFQSVVLDSFDKLNHVIMDVIMGDLAVDAVTGDYTESELKELPSYGEFRKSFALKPSIRWEQLGNHTGIIQSNLIYVDESFHLLSVTHSDTRPAGTEFLEVEDGYLIFSRTKNRPWEFGEEADWKSLTPAHRSLISDYAASTAYQLDSLKPPEELLGMKADDKLHFIDGSTLTNGIILDRGSGKIMANRAIFTSPRDEEAYMAPSYYISGKIIKAIMDIGDQAPRFSKYVDEIIRVMIKSFLSIQLKFQHGSDSTPLMQQLFAKVADPHDFGKFCRLHKLDVAQVTAWLAIRFTAYLIGENAVYCHLKLHQVCGTEKTLSLENAFLNLLRGRILCYIAIQQWAASNPGVKQVTKGPTGINGMSAATSFSSIEDRKCLAINKTLIQSLSKRDARLYPPLSHSALSDRDASRIPALKAENTEYIQSFVTKLAELLLRSSIVPAALAFRTDVAKVSMGIGVEASSLAPEIEAAEREDLGTAQKGGNDDKNE